VKVLKDVKVISVPKHYAMNMYSGLEAEWHAFWASALRVEWSSSLSDHCTLGKDGEW